MPGHTSVPKWPTSYPFPEPPYTWKVGSSMASVIDTMRSGAHDPGYSTLFNMPPAFHKILIYDRTAPHIDENNK